MREIPGERFRASDLPPGRVPVLFRADWCGYCHRFAPHFRRLPGAVAVDISDEDLPAWDEHGIDVVPTVILFEGGKPGRRWAGVLAAHHADEMQAALEGRADTPPREG